MGYKKALKCRAMDIREGDTLIGHGLVVAMRNCGGGEVELVTECRGTRSCFRLPSHKEVVVL